MTPPISKETLEHMYIVQKQSASEIAGLLGMVRQTILNWLHYYEIPVRPAHTPKGRKISDAARLRLSLLRRGSGNHRYGKQQSDETKAKIAAKAQGRIASEETRQKMRENNHGKNNPFFGRHHSEESRMRLSGERHPNFGKTPPHGTTVFYTNIDGSQIRMRSTWELRIAEALDTLGIAWQYEPQRFRLYNHTYTPDFYLPSLDVFYEVKGWFNDRNQQIVREFRALYPQHALIVVTKPVMLMLERLAKKGD